MSTEFVSRVFMRPSNLFHSQSLQRYYVHEIPLVSHEPYVHHPDRSYTGKPPGPGDQSATTPTVPCPSSDYDTDLCAFALSSSSFAARSFACSCLVAAFTFLCRFRRRFPRLGPSTTTGSAMRCFRFASCSARCFSRFLSRLRSVVKDALRRPP